MTNNKVEQKVDRKMLESLQLKYLKHTVKIISPNNCHHTATALIGKTIRNIIQFSDVCLKCGKTFRRD